MNKSKILKRSLAVILAMMMIFAMIPLSASAAVTALEAIYIDGVLVNNSGDTFTADVKADKTQVNVLVDQITAAEGAVVVETENDDNEVDVSTAAVDLTLANYTRVSNTITIPLVVSNGTDSKEYSIVLNIVALNTTALVDTATMSDNKAISVTVNNEARKIEVITPLGYNDDGNLTLATKDSAKISGTGVTGTGPYVLANAEDGATFVVTSESGGNSVQYTVEITEQPVLTAFKLGDYAGTITEYDDEGALLAKGVITIDTLPKASIKKGTDGKYPANTYVLDWTALSGTTLEIATNSEATAEVVKGKAYDKLVIDDGITDGQGKFDDDDGTKIVVTAKYKTSGIDREYVLKLSTVKDTDNTITAATIDGETATISGQSITATLAKTAAEDQEIVLTAPDTATVTVPVKILNDESDTTAQPPTKGTADDDGNNTFTFKADIDKLKAGIIIGVTSEAGAKKQYTIKVTATGDISEAKITTFALKDGDDSYKGTISGKNITVTVPYMTTSAQLKAMKLVVNTNAYVKAVDSANTEIVSSTTTWGGVNDSTTFDADTNTATAMVGAVAKSDGDVYTAYNITVKLDTAKTGKTLSALTLTSADNTDDVTAANTYKASIDASKQAISVETSYTDYNTTADLYVSSVTPVNGAVLLMIVNDNNDYYLAPIPEAITDDDSESVAIHKIKNDAAKDATFLGLIAMTEKDARALMEDAANDPDVALKAATKETVSTGAADGVAAVKAHAGVKGTWYTMVIGHKTASSIATLNSLKINDITFKYVPETSLPNGLNNLVSATIPYSMTVSKDVVGGAALTDDEIEENAYFATFEVGANAKLTFVDNNDDSVRLLSDGDDKDWAYDTNAKVVFVNNGDGTATAYRLTNDKKVTDDTKLKNLVVTAEDENTSMNYYLGTVKVAAANTEAEIKSFSVAGNRGVIKAADDDVWTITVNVPFGTDLTELVPTFTASENATVADEGGNEITSGETVLDFSDDVTLIVTSEDGLKRVKYVVSVASSDQFPDVAEKAWYYDKVMAAAAAGIINGYPDGTFQPNGTVTRGEFAQMLVKMLGVDTSVYTESAFSDVSATAYYSKAVAYMKDAEITAGYPDGTFHPTATISRQEAAVMMAKALNLVHTTEVKFGDDANIASWAKAAAYQCKAGKIFNGDSEGNFNPTSNLSRAEAATIMVNSLANL